jgi:hypothetical protein
MLLLNIKSIPFLLFCFAFFTSLTTILAQETPVQDSAETNLDLEALLAAIKHHDALLKSAEGEIVYIQRQPPFDTDTRIFTGRIAFDSENTRFDSPRAITILTPTTMWEIDPNAKRMPNYQFSTEPRLIPEDVDPRRWLTLWHEDLATYLKSENFQITESEFIDDKLCYVLEAQHGNSSEKLWITPEQGFRYLKYESRSPRPVDALDSDIPTEALTIDRTTVSYQQFGEVWFPKDCFREYAWLDFQATDPIILRQTLVVKNFKVNHDIPSETFIVDLPDSATVLVNRQILSKEEFLKQYGELLSESTDPIWSQ